MGLALWKSLRLDPHDRSIVGSAGRGNGGVVSLQMRCAMVQPL